MGAQAMLDEVDGPMNFTQMVTLFATKMAGGSDDDDVILASFEAFEQDGKIDAETFIAQLMTFGNKFSASEVDDAFAEFQIDGGMIDAAHLKVFVPLHPFFAKEKRSIGTGKIMVLFFSAEM